ncbi:HAAS signaling domain-containing protein [Pseudarthrobacter sp. NPDC092424]|uniref:HAAS signaling domain-containing protein n=1 Tax=Pseudarthrobacter sp. NPDC092424 TaxID=3364415 RepID=UPI00382710F7
MPVDEYLKTLAYELRQRKQSEEMVHSTLQEVRSYIAESGESAEAAFGQPRDYAASFPEGTTTSRGARVGTLAGLVVIVTLAAYLVLRGAFGISFGISGTLAYFGVVVAVTAALIVTGQHLDRRLPDLREANRY